MPPTPTKRVLIKQPNRAFFTTDLSLSVIKYTKAKPMTPKQHPHQNPPSNGRFLFTLRFEIVAYSTKFNQFKNSEFFAFNSVKVIS